MGLRRDSINPRALAFLVSYSRLNHAKDDLLLMPDNYIHFMPADSKLTSAISQEFTNNEILPPNDLLEVGLEIRSLLAYKYNKHYICNFVVGNTSDEQPYLINVKGAVERLKDALERTGMNTAKISSKENVLTGSTRFLGEL